MPSLSSHNKGETEYQSRNSLYRWLQRRVIVRIIKVHSTVFEADELPKILLFHPYIHIKPRLR